jgi:hypothetical protein
MSVPTDPFDTTESVAGHGVLATLARRGAERGAPAVLDGARHAARRHRQRRRVGTGALAVLLVAGIVGAGVVVVRDDRPPVTAGDPPPQGADPQPRVVTGVRIVGHDGFDRVEIDVAGDPIPPELWPEPALPDRARPEGVPQCHEPDFDPVVNLTWGVHSDVSPTPDGLPAELSGRRFAGDGVYVREVIPLCAVDGLTRLGIVYVDPSLAQRHLELPPNPDFSKDPLEDFDFTGELTFRACESDDPQQEVVDFFRWTDPDGETPPSQVCG